MEIHWIQFNHLCILNSLKLYLNWISDDLFRVIWIETHLDFLKKKLFALEVVFFFVFPFTADTLQRLSSALSFSHFNLALVTLSDFETPNNVPSLIFLLLLEACSWFCWFFFDVVKFCKKQNITLRVIAHLSTIRAMITYIKCVAAYVR